MKTVIAHPTRVALLAEFADGKMHCPRDLAERLAEPLGVASYHVRCLHEAGVLRLMRTRSVRGAVAHDYKLGVRGRRGVIEALAELEATAHRARVMLEALR